ncbi:guanine nucleotide binding protein, alpha subunit [Rhizoclosmatium globosum]|uniref:Guanine nucleotide binding protein, alpha subunit n=1 Tax=Rhizoclosmatium globosum TaxID=329046 RepID=A0A1Y2BQ29_9FUNG|nr:guanine nucleotide binding protein, alpha subunit [Rhizoclosmatium globosum]|eukprot:ORY36850.1 guanine nucleotide binding protein, alpha subunit [Rhizoclosmatium globosum]
MTLIYGNGFSQEQLETFCSAIQLNLLVSITTLIKEMDRLKIPYGFQKPVNLEEANRRLSQLPTVSVLVVVTDSAEDVIQSPESSALDSNGGKPLNADVSQQKLGSEEGRCGLIRDPIAELADREYDAANDAAAQQSENAELAREFRKLEHPSFGFNLKMAITKENIEIIKKLWKDSGIQYCYSRANEFQLIDCCAYMMEHIDRISAPDYKPTNEDILNARVTTIGVHETKFKMEGMSIIFLVAISAYDQVCSEDEETNRVVESMNLFGSICNHPLFKKTDMVLFFNKIDLFQEKVKKRPISLYFHDYEGPAEEYEPAANYFKKRFTDINKYPNEKRIYTHLTHATDTSMTKKVLASVLDSICPEKYMY